MNFVLVKTTTGIARQMFGTIGNAEVIIDELNMLNGPFFLSKIEGNNIIPYQNQEESNFLSAEEVKATVIRDDEHYDHTEKSVALEWRNRYLTARVKYLEGRVLEKEHPTK